MHSTWVRYYYASLYKTEQLMISLSIHPNKPYENTNALKSLLKLMEIQMLVTEFQDLTDITILNIKMISPLQHHLIFRF